MSVRSRIALYGTTLLLLAVSAPSAEATGGGLRERDKQVTSGERNDQRLTAGAGFKGVVFDPPRGEGNGPLAPALASNWTPPPCYYAPKWKASEFKAFWDDRADPKAEKLNPGQGDEIREKHNKKYGPDSEYNDHNIDKEEEGAWWGAFVNHDSPDKSGLASCNQETFWVDNEGPLPDLPGMPTAEELAELAYAQVDIPDVHVELDPVDVQTIGLDTWVWVEAADLGPVSVTASLDGYGGLSSTVTATPTRLTLDPGTEDAAVHYSSGDGCPLNAGGSIGEQYEEGRAEEVPPCGISYLRATHNRDPYTLTAGLTWEISWQGSDGSGGDLPDGVFETTHELTVQEVQAIVR